jgi:hypothetical protein
MAGDPRIQVGSVVQIDPDHDPAFGACLLIVTEVKAWGVQGYVRIPSKSATGSGDAYYRVAFDKVAYVGEAAWVHQRHETEDV